MVDLDVTDMELISLFSVLGSIAAIIAALPTIKGWLAKKPTVTVSVNDTELPPNERIKLCYILPEDKRFNVYYLQFPVNLGNNTNGDVKNFLIQINADVSKDGLKRIRSIDGYTRMAPDMINYSMTDSNWLNLKETKPFKRSEKHTIGNKYREIIFPSGKRYQLEVRLTSTRREGQMPDTFVVEITTQSRLNRSEKYIFDIECHYSNNKERILEKLKKDDNEHILSFVVVPEYKGYTWVDRDIKNSDEKLLIGWLDTDENNVTPL